MLTKVQFSRTEMAALKANIGEVLPPILRRVSFVALTVWEAVAGCLKKFCLSKGADQDNASSTKMDEDQLKHKSLS